MGRKPAKKPNPKVSQREESKEALRFEGPFHETLWKLLEPYNQTSISEAISREKGVKWSASTIRTHWNNRNWKQPNKAIIEDEYFTAQVYPHLPGIVKFLATKNDQTAKEALSFIRYRFLTESYRLSLYRPYPESHRFSSLLNWAYFPDTPLQEREKYERICFILGFNNDYQIYRHLCVLVDRVVNNPIHLTYLSNMLPKLAVLMVLFGDYHLSVETCRKVAPLIATMPMRYARASVYRYELQCLEADALSHISIPRGFEPSEPLRLFVVAMQELAETSNVQTDLDEDEIDHLLRMGYTCYFRALVRIILHLRIAEVPYLLPLNLDMFLQDFERRSEAYRERIESGLGSERDGAKNELYSGAHYSGLEFDTVARAYAFISTELVIREGKKKDVTPPDADTDRAWEGLSGSERIFIASRDEITSWMQRASDCLTISRRLFQIGDDDDQAMLARVLDDHSVIPPQVNCSNLSVYRRLSSMALIELQKANFTRTRDKPKFFSHKEKAEEHLRSFEKMVGVQHLRHARILSERIQTLVTKAKFGHQFDWFDLLES